MPLLSFSTPAEPTQKRSSRIMANHFQTSSLHILSEKALFYQPFSEFMPIQRVWRLRWSTRCIKYLASRRKCIMLLIYQPKEADASCVLKLWSVLLFIYVKESGWTIHWKENVFSAINIFAKCTKLNLFAEILNNKYFFFCQKWRHNLWLHHSESELSTFLHVFII